MKNILLTLIVFGSFGLVGQQSSEEIRDERLAAEKIAKQKCEDISDEDDYRKCFNNSIYGGKRALIHPIAYAHMKNSSSPKDRNQKTKKLIEDKKENEARQSAAKASFQELKDKKLMEEKIKIETNKVIQNKIQAGQLEGCTGLICNQSADNSQ